MITLIHPSRSRIDQSAFITTKWFKEANNILDIELIVSVDSDDPQLEQYKMIYQDDIIINNNRSAVDAINKGAKKANGNIFIVVSDDTDCFNGWDTALLSEVSGKTDWILKTRDGIQDWIITNPIMDRAYFNRFGYIYYPEYDHQFCDTDLTCVADILGRKLTSSLMFRHLHDSIKDDLRNKTNATSAQGEKLFLQRYRRNFDLNVSGKIQGQGMINWLIAKRQEV